MIEVGVRSGVRAARDARLLDLATRVTETEQRLAVLRLSAEDVVRELYMTAGSDGAVSTILGSSRFSDIPVRGTYLDAASNHDLRVVDEWVAVEGEYRRRVAALDGALDRQRDLVAEVEGLAAQLLAELDAANDEYRDLEATWQHQEEERKRREEERKLLMIRRGFDVGSPPTCSPRPSTIPTRCPSA